MMFFSCNKKCTTWNCLQKTNEQKTRQCSINNNTVTLFFFQTLYLYLCIKERHKFPCIIVFFLSDWESQNLFSSSAQ